MGLTVILLFGVFILPILLGILLLRKSRKVATIFLSIPFIFIIGVVSWWFYETNYRFISSTDLSGEQIGELAINDTVTESMLTTFGEYEKRENVNYNELYVFEDIEIGVSVREQIIYLSTVTHEMSTAKGINVGDSADTITKTYGEKFFRRSDMGLGESINYVDRDQKVHLQFWLQDDKIVQISLQAI